MVLKRRHWYSSYPFIERKFIYIAINIGIDFSKFNRRGATLDDNTSEGLSKPSNAKLAPKILLQLMHHTFIPTVYEHPVSPRRINKSNFDPSVTYHITNPF